MGWEFLVFLVIEASEHDTEVDFNNLMFSIFSVLAPFLLIFSRRLRSASRSFWFRRSDETRTRACELKSEN